MMKKLITGTAALALATTLAACSDADESDDPTTPVTSPTVEATTNGDDSDDRSGDDATDDADDATDDATTEYVTRTANGIAAIMKAEEETGGQATNIDYEDDDKTWDVVVVADGVAHELTLNEDGSEVVSRDDQDDDEDDIQHIAKAEVTLVDAIDIASPQVPDGVLEDAELDEDDGTVRWEITLNTDGRDRDVIVDAVSGEILN